MWDNVPMMETKSGGNYVIWPVVWQALTNAGLESVDVEEVHPHSSISRTHAQFDVLSSRLCIVLIRKGRHLRFMHAASAYFGVAISRIPLHHHRALQLLISSGNRRYSAVVPSL